MSKIRFRKPNWLKRFRFPRLRRPRLKNPERVPAFYEHIYRMFLKHAVSGGKIRGNIIEVGSQHGLFLEFLFNESILDKEGSRIIGLDPNPLDMSDRAHYLTESLSIEQFAEEYAGEHRAQDFIIAKNIFGSPSADPVTLIHGISQLAKKGSKVFLQTEKAKEMPSNETLRLEGLKKIDSFEKPGILVWVLKKIR